MTVEGGITSSAQMKECPKEIRIQESLSNDGFEVSDEEARIIARIALNLWQFSEACQSKLKPKIFDQNHHLIGVMS